MLLGEAQVQSIQRALSEHAGRPVKLVIEPGEPDVETPAARRARITAERQRAAESLLESDETVQSLLAEFGGRLDEVQPLEATGRAADDKRRTG
jgi:DNA polymerase-3 subunit gamma/tau